mmetsp:Transcript_63/g.226  ORF Transcript_63/g.226 Transcript_63/m.226 type:complete len:209 (-) Transcript_63:3336-3962(-)
MMFKPHNCASLNSSSSTHAKQTSFHVLGVFAFRAASTAAWNWRKRTKVEANAPQLDNDVYNTLAASNKFSSKHRSPTVCKFAAFGLERKSSNAESSSVRAYAYTISVSTFGSFKLFRTINKYGTMASYSSNFLAASTTSSKVVMSFALINEIIAALTPSLPPCNSCALPSWHHTSGVSTRSAYSIALSMSSIDSIKMFIASTCKLNFL